MARKRVKYQLEDNIKRVVRLNDGGDTTIINRDVTFATRQETDEGVLTTKAIHPDGGGYAYDRLRWPNQHYAGKGTKDYSLAAIDGVVAVDCRKSNVFEYTATDDFTLANPVNGYSGQVINIKLIQDSVGGHEVTFGSAYQWMMGATPVMSTGPGSVDMISAQYRSSTGKWLCSYLPDFTGTGTGWGSLPEGPEGDQGPRGYSVLNGAGAPGAGVGDDGDFYLDTTAWDIYGPKTAGAWGSGTSIIGPTGPAGADGVVQSIVPGTNVTVDDTDPANPIVSASGGGGGGTPDTVFSWVDDFVLENIDTSGNPWDVVTANGGSVTRIDSNTSAPGVVRVSTGTSSASGQASLYASANAAATTDAQRILLGTDAVRVFVRAKFPVLPSVAQNGSPRFGLADSTTLANRIQMVLFHDGTNVVWRTITANGGSSTVTDFAASVTADTYYLLEIVADSSGAEFFVDGVSLGAAVTTSIPTAGMTLHAMAFKSAGTGTALAIDIDLIGVEIEFATPRY